MVRFSLFLVLLFVLVSTVFANDKCDRHVIERFQRRDNRPCVRWSTGDYECLGDNDFVGRLLRFRSVVNLELLSLRRHPVSGGRRHQ